LNKAEATIIKFPWKSTACLLHSVLHQLWFRKWWLPQREVSLEI